VNDVDVLRMLFERGNAMQSFWGFYLTISIGLIAFFGNARRPRILAVLLSLAFIAFATVNCDGMTDIAGQRSVLFNALQSGVRVEPASSSVLPRETTENLMEVSEPPTPKSVATFHVLADLGVLAAVWILTLRPKEG
jgi:hypothetical protein